MHALVGETHTRSALSGIRGLGRAGHPLIAIAANRSAAGLRSRYVNVSAVIPDVQSAPQAYAARIAELAREHGPVMAYPVQETGIDALYDHPSPRVHLPWPGIEPVRRVRDKRSLPELASEAGLGTPRVIAHGRCAELAGAQLPFPCVVKPFGKGGAIESARPIGSQEQLRAFLGALPPEAPLLVQEWLAGQPFSIALVLGRDGRVVARFQQRALRTWPRDAGSSARAVSTAPDERLVARAAGVLNDIGYYGLAQLQFMSSERGPLLIDINPRFFGSMPLALAAGVNLPAAWHAVALDEPAPVAGPYRLGVSFRWLEADMVAAVSSPGLLLQRAPRPSVGAVWVPDDPLPGIVYGVQSVLKRIDRLPRQLRARFAARPDLNVALRSPR